MLLLLLFQKNEKGKGKKDTHLKIPSPDNKKRNSEKSKKTEKKNFHIPEFFSPSPKEQAQEEHHRNKDSLSNG